MCAFFLTRGEERRGGGVNGMGEEILFKGISHAVSLDRKRGSVLDGWCCRIGKPVMMMIMMMMMIDDDDAACWLAAVFHSVSTDGVH